MILFLSIFNRCKEPPKPTYKYWGEPRQGGVECWKPTIIFLNTGRSVRVPRFYDFGTHDEYIYICKNSDDTGVWTFMCGEKISKNNIVNIFLQ